MQHEIMLPVTASGGQDSDLDADKLDGQSSSAFLPSKIYECRTTSRQAQAVVL